MSADRQCVLVLGGCGFIGRHLVKLLQENDYFVRVVDKRTPSMADLNEEFEKYFDEENNKLVEYIQADLSREKSAERAFAPSEEHPEVTSFAFVFNLTAVTQLGHEKQIYDTNVLESARQIAKQCKERGLRLIHFSDARLLHVSASDKKAHAATEDAEQKGSTTLAQVHGEAEKVIMETCEDYVILRPAVVYGIGDKDGLTPRLLCGSIYRFIKKPMKMLWSADIRLNTVHVEDVARAALLAAKSAPKGAVYNLADTADSTQGSIGAIIHELYGIETGFFNAMINAAAAAAEKVAEHTVNETHVQPWQDMCTAQSIQPKLSPVLSSEILRKKHVWVDGQKIVTDLGFQYQVPAPTADLCRAQLEDYIKAKAIPDVFK